MTDQEVAIQIKVPRKFRLQLQKEALNRDETMKTFILKALRKEGLSVPQSLLKDKRKNHSK